jgi:hypothetical protein
MSDEIEIIEITTEDLQKQMADAVAASNFDTFGQLRRVVRAGFSCPCLNCYDYQHPDAEHWGKAVEAAYCLDLDWRNLP